MKGERSGAYFDCDCLMCEEARKAHPNTGGSFKVISAATFILAILALLIGSAIIG